MFEVLNMKFVSISSFAIFALISGCSEYDIAGNEEIRGEPNPPVLEIPPNEDRIVQVTSPAVDVLWTIDNSCSMLDEQVSLTSNFDAFMNYFLGSGLDYHVGVISTDNTMVTHQGTLREVAGERWIADDTQDPITVFSAMASLGTSGSATEAGRSTTYKAIELKKNAENIDFIREEAGLHIIVISDEQDQSTANPISKLEFIDYLATLKTEEDAVTFSSIVNGPACGNFCNGGESAGTNYIDVTLGVGGILSEIHADEWVEVLEQLGVQAAGLKREFFLTELPVPGTIKVEILDEGTVFTFVEGDDWNYDAARNSIVFVEYIPSPLAEVHITYDKLSVQ